MNKKKNLMFNTKAQKTNFNINISKLIIIKLCIQITKIFISEQRSIRFKQEIIIIFLL